MENLNILSQGNKGQLMNDPQSPLGRMLRDSNIDGYLYTNMASVSPRKYKCRSTMIGL